MGPAGLRSLCQLSSPTYLPGCGPTSPRAWGARGGAWQRPGNSCLLARRKIIRQRKASWPPAPPHSPTLLAWWLSGFTKPALRQLLPSASILVDSDLPLPLCTGPGAGMHGWMPRVWPYPSGPPPPLHPPLSWRQGRLIVQRDPSLEASSSTCPWVGDSRTGSQGPELIRVRLGADYTTLGSWALWPLRHQKPRDLGCGFYGSRVPGVRRDGPIVTLADLFVPAAACPEAPSSVPA